MSIYETIKENIQMGPIELAYVKNIIQTSRDNAQMTEWGSGGSTLMWLDTLKSTQKLISIEHNQNWYDRVTRGVNEHFENSNNFEFLYIPEEYIQHGYATPIEEHPMGLAKYINPNANVFDSDIFFIDGIGRSACLMNVLLKHTKPDPTIFIHDHVGREGWYDWATQHCKIEVVGETLARMYI